MATVLIGMAVPGACAAAQTAAANTATPADAAADALPGPAPRISVYTPATGMHPLSGATPKPHSTFSVDAAATDWTDTHTTVVAGTTLTFATTGSITLADHTLTADGMLRGWRDMLRHFPVDTANAGALVGRIGNSEAAVPFAIGTASNIVATQTGDLFLRVNSSAELPAVGTFNVDLRMVPAATAAVLNKPSSAAGNSMAAPAEAAFPALDPLALDALPRRVTDREGRPGDATNFALLGTEQQVRTAFARAGWVQVDADTTTAVLHGLLNTLEHKPYVEVPMSTLYLFGRPQDLSFARASAITVATERHHLRCWQTTVTVSGVPLWIGAATHDIGLERDDNKGNITHRIAPEIDEERDFLRDTFLGSGAAASAAYFTPAAPLRSAQTATGGSFTTDGRMLLLHLR